MEKIQDTLLLLAQEPDPARLIELAAKAAAHHINAETVAVPLLSPDNLEIHYVYACGHNKEKFLHLKLPIEKAGLCAWVMENRKPFLCEKLTGDPRVSGDLAEELGYTTAVLAPLIARGRIIGALSAFKDGPSFTKGESAGLTMIANYAAVAIENARLMLELSKERRKLNSILDGVEDGIILMSDKGEVLKANKSVEKYLPMKSDELVGASVREFMGLSPLDKIFGWNIPAVPGQRCWEIKGCRWDKCPMYMKDHVRCWSLSDGCCNDGNLMEGGDGKLWNRCRKCELLDAASEALGKKREINIMGRSLTAVSTIIKPESPGEPFGEVIVLHDVTPA